MGILESIKNSAKKNAQSKSDILFIKSGSKKRIRMLGDIEEGLEINTWYSYSEGIEVLATEDNSDTYENKEGFKLKTVYAFPVWDVEEKKQKIMLYGAHKYSPLPTLASMHEEYGNWNDRDYVIKVEGTRLDKTFAVIPQKESKFATKIKVWSEKEMMKIIGAIYDKDDEEETPKANKKTSTKSKKKEVVEEVEEKEYSDMKPMELYKLCKERDIEAKTKQKADYYIDLLEEYDADQESEEEDEWEDDAEEDGEDW